MEQKTKTDLQYFIKFINNHEKKNDIKNVFFKGPDPEYGFIWTPKEWWNKDQANALEIVKNELLKLNYENSGFGIMMRILQKELKKTIPIADEVYDLNDNEGKYYGDPRSGKGSPFYISNNINYSYLNEKKNDLAIESESESDEYLL